MSMEGVHLWTLANFCCSLVHHGTRHTEQVLWSMVKGQSLRSILCYIRSSSYLTWLQWCSVLDQAISSSDQL